ncbi:hypothetical protein [Micromonospora aurantiaca (nom. illeg.)]|uniref:hypothetical protein n=1 Tax=Micromonospora aurantiaca (nom. illeg.) TaxID=47850 RepID=UPI003408E723
MILVVRKSKRSRKWVYGKTEREVLGKLVDLRRRQEQGQNLAAAPRSRRTVPVPAQTLALFRAHRRQQAADRLMAGERWKDDGLVFPSKVGTPMDPDHIDRTWHKIRAAAGLDAHVLPEIERAAVDEAAKHLFG